MAVALVGLGRAVLLSQDSMSIEYDTPRKLAELSDDINESSGLAVSHRDPNVFWTHNDSGDAPRILAFDAAGKPLGECRIQGATALDWEDMASFERDGKSWLLLADTGDNSRRRRAYSLYLCEEPPVTASQASAVEISFVFEDGSHDCEAVGVDVAEDRILLATKEFLSQSGVYELRLPDGPADKLVARRIATIPVSFATAMDISADGRRAVVCTYGDGFLFIRDQGESWQQAFGRPPQRLQLPERRQGESICFGRDGRTLYLTSEKSPSPLWKMAPRN